MVRIGQNEHLFGQHSDSVFLWVLMERDQASFLCFVEMCLPESESPDRIQTSEKIVLYLWQDIKPLVG